MPAQVVDWAQSEFKRAVASDVTDEAVPLARVSSCDRHASKHLAASRLWFCSGCGHGVIVGRPYDGDVVCAAMQSSAHTRNKALQLHATLGAAPHQDIMSS